MFFEYFGGLIWMSYLGLIIQQSVSNLEELWECINCCPLNTGASLTRLTPNICEPTWEYLESVLITCPLNKTTVVSPLGSKPGAFDQHHSTNFWKTFLVASWLLVISVMRPARSLFCTKLLVYWHVWHVFRAGRQESWQCFLISEHSQRQNQKWPFLFRFAF